MQKAADGGVPFITDIIEFLDWPWQEEFQQYNDSHPAITYSKLTTEALKQGVKYIQN